MKPPSQSDIDPSPSWDEGNRSLLLRVTLLAFTKPLTSHSYAQLGAPMFPFPSSIHSVSECCLLVVPGASPWGFLLRLFPTLHYHRNKGFFLFNFIYYYFLNPGHSFSSSSTQVASNLTWYLGVVVHCADEEHWVWLG